MLLHIFRKSVFVFAALTVAPQTLAASESAPLTLGSETDKLFSQWTLNTPGASIAIARRGNVILAAGYGSADLRLNVPITPRTMFAIGSITKQFTAFAVYRLYLSRKIALNSSILDYLPELPPLMEHVTIQELLWQTSGIRDYIELAAMSGHQLGDSLATQDAIALLQRQRRLNFTPGTRYNYSNSNYALLAEIIHRVTHETFAQYAADAIFRPLGMRDSTIQDSHASIIPNMARSYWPAETKGQYQEAAIGTDVVGDAGLVTTPHDLLIWESNLMVPVVGSREIGMLLHPALLSNGRAAHGTAGSGIDVDTEDGLKVLRYDGGVAGFRADVVAYPEKGVSIAVFTNLVTFFPDEEINSLADLLLDRKPLPTEAPPQPQPTNTFSLGAARLNNYRGGYHSDELDTTYWICPAASVLIARHVFGSPVTLTPVAKDAFNGSYWGFNKAVFTRDGEGHVNGVNVSGFRAANAVAFKKISNTCDLK